MFKKREEFEPNVKYGIHSNPLPLFSQNNKMWWTNQRGYCPNPKEVSQLKLMHQIMMKNPNDVYLFEDKDANSIIKKNFKLKKKRKEGAEKPNNVKIYYSTSGMKMKPSKMRWTDDELLHSRKKKRIFD